ncbi:MAG: hypothetical protein QOC89_3097, partial [Paraburkholderia sp.]|nr:hypothetical protein [Paraburkholderia sp.]
GTRRHNSWGCYRSFAWRHSLFPLAPGHSCAIGGACGVEFKGWVRIDACKVPNLPVRPAFQETFQAVQQNGEIARRAQGERPRAVRTARLRWRLLLPAYQQVACPCRDGPPWPTSGDGLFPAYCVRGNRAVLRMPWRSLLTTCGLARHGSARLFRDALPENLASTAAQCRGHP